MHTLTCSLTHSLTDQYAADCILWDRDFPYDMVSEDEEDYDSDDEEEELEREREMELEGRGRGYRGGWWNEHERIPYEVDLLYNYVMPFAG